MFVPCFQSGCITGKIISQHKKGGWRILLSGTDKKADICHNAAKGRSWIDFASSLPDKLLRNGD